MTEQKNSDEFTLSLLIIVKNYDLKKVSPFHVLCKFIKCLTCV